MGEAEVEDCTGCPCGPPEGTVNVITDVVSILSKFSNLSCAVTKVRADVTPPRVDFTIGIGDVVMCLGAFTGGGYPYGSGQCVDGQCSGGDNHALGCENDDDCAWQPCP